MFIENHINELNKTIIDLRDIDVTICDEDQGIVLMGSLLNSYNHFMDIMMHGKDTHPELKWVKEDQTY